MTPLGRVLPLRVANIVGDALADTRVVLVTGAWQCGKSTLVRLQVIATRSGATSTRR